MNGDVFLFSVYLIWGMLWIMDMLYYGYVRLCIPKNLFSVRYIYFLHFTFRSYTPVDFLSCNCAVLMRAGSHYNYYDNPFYDKFLPISQKFGHFSFFQSNVNPTPHPPLRGPQVEPTLLLAVTFRGDGGLRVIRFMNSP